MATSMPRAYHSRVRSLSLAVLVAVGLGGWLTSTAAVAVTARGTGAADRLERFRELAASRLSAGQILESERPDEEAYREIYALLDEEIVDSLASGSVFASTEFLQDRLDAFGEAWGGARFTLTRRGRLVVGAFELGHAGNSIRVYGGLGGEAALLATMYRDGRPTVYPLPAPEEQFIVAWEGASSGRGTRALRVDLVRPHGDGVRVVWSTADLFREGLLARAYSVRGGELRVRYELHYPGWAPGCGGQTEQEDLYRLAPAGAGFVRVSRQEHNAWHRDFRTSVARLFEALAAGDEAALALVVPDKDLRARLPALAAEPACDAPDGPGRDAVSVAAVAADHRPWSLTFRRGGASWRLTAAAPVLH